MAGRVNQRCHIFVQVQSTGKFSCLPIGDFIGLGWHRVEDSILGDLLIPSTTQLVIPNIFLVDEVFLSPAHQQSCPDFLEVFIYLGEVGGAVEDPVLVFFGPLAAILKHCRLKRQRDMFLVEIRYVFLYR